MLVFIALFVWIGAAQESSIVQMRSALGGIPVERVMITDFRSLSPHEPLSSAVEHILAGSQQDFPVVEEGRVVGILTRSDLLTGLTKRGQQAEISEVMQKKFETAAPSEMADRVFARLQRCDCHTLPVLRNGELVGIVTMENVGEFLMIQSALDEAKKGKKTIPTLVAADRS
jgi:CBS domain-containing protein